MSDRRGRTPIGYRNGLPIYPPTRRVKPDKTRGCAVDGCDRPHYCKLLCALHYQRQSRNGRTDQRSAEERFWVKVEKTDTCWLWRGATSKSGYGNFNLGNGRGYDKPYRYAYTILVGPIPPGLTIDHLCRTPACVNPAHLEVVSMRENQRRTRRDTCHKGHPIVEKYGRRLCYVCLIERNLVRQKRRKSFPPSLRKAVKVRAAGFCEHCDLPIIGWGHVHHRKLQGQGGEHSLSNCVHLRDDCHRAIHANPELSYGDGWLVRSGDTPEEIPLNRCDGHRFLLLDDGSMRVVEEAA